MTIPMHSDGKFCVQMEKYDALAARLAQARELLWDIANRQNLTADQCATGAKRLLKRWATDSASEQEIGVTP
jgi:hypothetical protein